MLWQVGCVGDLGFKFDGYSNDNFQVLVDYLESVYGPEQELINYVASMFGVSKPSIATHLIGDLRDPKVAQTVTGVSTFFIRASVRAQSDAEISATLGLRVGAARGTPLICDRADYLKLKAIAQVNNRNHAVPPGYKFSHASPALYETLYDLSMDPSAERAFSDDPDAFLEQREGLTVQDRRYLRMGHLGLVRMMFKADPDKEADRFVDAALRRPYLADSYRAKQHVEHGARRRGEITPAQYQEAMCRWFIEQGFATTPAAATRSIRAVRLIRADTPAASPDSAAVALEA
jgi:hypothetical protein